MSAQEIKERVGRFADLKPLSPAQQLDWVPQEAKDVILARDLRPVILERSKSPFGNVAPIFGAAGMTMNVSTMPPGQGPCLHSHESTYETFVVLQGEIEFSVGPEGEESVTLGQWDTFSCPPGVYRGFRNSGASEAVLLTVISGAVEARDDVCMPPGVGREIEQRFGDNVLNAFKELVKFNEE